MKAGSFSRVEQIALVAAVLLTAAVLLAPVLRTPLMGDDAFNSYMSGYMQAQHLNFWAWYLQYTHDVAATNSRFFPGMALVQVIKFSFTHDALPLKIANIVAICLNIGTFFVVVRQLATTRIALLASLLAVAALQERAFYESIAEITVESQIVWELILLTFLAAIAYAKRPTLRRLVILTAMYVVSNATYEISYTFIVAYAGIAFIDAGRAAARRVLVALGSVFVAFVALNVLLRHAVGVSKTSEYAMGLDPVAYTVTLFNQVASAFPLTYFLSNPGGFFADRRVVVFGVAHLGAVVGIAATIIALIVLLRPSKAREAGCDWDARAAWFAGACMLVLPGVLIALSVRWQSEIKFGLPYQPAYAEGFGAALLLALAAAALLRALPKGSAAAPVALALVIGFTVFVTYQANAKIYPTFARAWLYPLDALTGAERHGALDAAPSGSTVLFDSDYAYKGSGSGYSATGSQIYMNTHRAYTLWVLDDPSLDPSILCAAKIANGACSEAIPNLYYFRVRGTGPGLGTAITLRVKSFNAPARKDDVITPRGPAATVYEQSPGVAAAQRSPALGTGFVWTQLAAQDDYRLWSGHSACGGDVALPAAEAGNDVEWRFGSGFYMREGSPGDYWHWASATSRLALVNNTDRVQSVDAKIRFETYAPGLYALRIREGDRVTSLPLDRNPVDFEIKRNLRQGEIDEFELSTDAARVSSGADPRDLRLQAFGAAVRSVPGACPR